VDIIRLFSTLNCDTEPKLCNFGATSSALNPHTSRGGSGILSNFKLRYSPIMSLLIRGCVRTTLYGVLAPSKLGLIITRGLSSLRHGSVTKFHTNWPPPAEEPGNKLFRDGTLSGGTLALPRVATLEAKGTKTDAYFRTKVVSCVFNPCVALGSF